MIRSLHRHILLPAYESGVKRRRTMRYWRELEHSQWWGSAQLETSQFRALQRLLTHAHETCPYFRKRWDELGLHPRRLRSLGDLSLWPVLERDEIREHRARLRSTAPPAPLISKATGGSSGVPLQFDLDLLSNDRRMAAWHRGYGWAGAEPGTRQLYLWGTPLGARTLRSRLKDRVYHALYRRTVLSCMDGRDELPRRFLAALGRTRPEAIVAYTSPLYEVARWADEQGISIDHPPRAVVLGAEKLHGFQRTLIERTFRAPVFETYGSREFMLIGAECERHAGLHLTSENLLLEILDDDGRPAQPGTEGNVVVTDLHNLGMPFVRYATGDRAIAGFQSCPCGRGLPLLRGVTGRRLDTIVGSGGRPVPGEFFPHLAKEFPAIRRFQVIQEEATSVRVAMKAEGLTADDRARFEARVRAALGPEIRLHIEPVSEVPLTPAGKLQVVVNRMGQRRAA
jgi:phenylacetate-CoA ligase